MPPDPLLLIYTAFVVASHRLRAPLGEMTGDRPLPVRYVVLMLAVGMITETLAWSANYLARAEHPALLHPQLLYDWLLSPGVYGGWALAWLILTRRWRFSIAEVFVLQGCYGIAIEQQGAVLVKGLQALPIGLALWSYVFAVYGSAAALAFLPFSIRGAAGVPVTSRWKLVAAPMALLLATAIVAAAWPHALQIVGIHVPEARSIAAAPFF
jgi:hypothetical protein